MRSAIATLLAAISICAAPAAAATRILEVPDLSCRDSLAEEEGRLRDLQSAVETAASPLDRARLQRSHADWVRFRGTQCDLLTSGSPDRACCLQREVGKRIVDLELYRAHQGPADFRTWQDSPPPSEKDALRDLVLRQTPKFTQPALPDDVLRVGDGQYLLAFASAPDRAKGLKYANLRRGVLEPLMNGDVRLVQVLPDKAGARHVLVKQTETDRRILWTYYYLLRLGRKGDGLLVEDARLALFAADAGTRGCDEHTLTFLKLDNALVLDAIRYPDADGDGCADIVLEVREIDCQTQAVSPGEITFLAGESGFTRAVSRP